MNGMLDGVVSQLTGRLYSVLIYGIVNLVVFFIVKRVMIDFYGWRKGQANALGGLVGVFAGLLAAAPYFISHVLKF
jgi:hypothetical protein